MYGPAVRSKKLLARTERAGSGYRASDILPRIVRSPVDICLGTRPNHAAKRFGRELTDRSAHRAGARRVGGERSCINAPRLIALGGLAVERSEDAKDNSVPG